MTASTETTDRPNPDALLQQLQREQQRSSRGRLKVFFGAAPGVGKTFAMLEEGRARAAEGLDVVVGYAEPHARPETEAMLIGMDLIPFRTVEYKGAKLKELDLEAVLKRHPQLVLIDELAHTNAPGMQHPKRYQDVQEILDAGINVYTTLNVQHLESLNDVVERITGVRVRETLPDSILEQADEVELIDTSPEELLERLQEGKVYQREVAERATRHFFTKGNITALRELALRRTADRVDAQMLDLRRTEGGAGRAWATRDRLLVCVGPSPTSTRLVRATRLLASGLRASWMAVYVETPGAASLSAAVRDRIAQTLRLAEQLGGEALTLAGARVADEVLSYARQRNVTKIVTGKPDRPRWRELLGESIVDQLIRRSGDIDIYAIRGEEEEEDGVPRRRLPLLRLRRRPQLWIGYAAALVAIVAASLLAWGLYRLLGLGPRSDVSNVVMVYLLAVVLVAARFGRGPAIVASFLGVAAFDFFFVPPFYTFAVSDTQYVFTFGVMLAVAGVTSTLTQRIREQAELARRRERRTAALLTLSRQLAATRDAAPVAQVAIAHVAEVFGAEAVLLAPPAGSAEGPSITLASRVKTFELNEKERGVADWAFHHGQSAGRGTTTLPAAEGLYLPLIASRGTVAVLGVRASDESRLQDPEQLRLLEAFASQTAAALERTRLADEARAAWERVEAEFLRNTLLSSVSHDLRTPLAAIAGTAETLLTADGSIDSATRRDLTQSVIEESRRMERVITNMLELTRLESGGMPLRREWQPIAEVVGAALNSLRGRLAGRAVRLDLPADLPLVNLDAVAFEQVLVNILDNAVEYTPASSPIHISARQSGDHLLLEITDGGPGIPPGTESKIFQKFFRSHAAGGRRGIGLGLAICKGIVEAHGGTISAFNPSGGGATFRIDLPVRGAPPAVPQD